MGVCRCRKLHASSRERKLQSFERRFWIAERMAWRRILHGGGVTGALHWEAMFLYRSLRRKIKNVVYGFGRGV